MGFSHLWVGDHFIFPNEGPGSDRAKRRVGFTSPNFLEAMATLTWAASSTRRIGLGTSVTIIPYHNPILLAQEMATLDVLSGGRIVLGAGIGWLEGEFNALGVPFFDRGPRTDEYLEIIKTIWTTPLATFRGSFSNFTNIRIPTMPVQKPHPPIFLGGRTLKILSRVVQWGDGWLPIPSSPDEIEKGYQVLEQMCAEIGRDVSSIKITVDHIPLERTLIKQYENVGASRAIVNFYSNPDDEPKNQLERIAELIL